MGGEGKDRMKLRFGWTRRLSDPAYRIVAVVGLLLGLIGFALGVAGIYLAIHSN